MNVIKCQAFCKHTATAHLQKSLLMNRGYAHKHCPPVQLFCHMCFNVVMVTISMYSFSQPGAVMEMSRVIGAVD